MVIIPTVTERNNQFERTYDLYSLLLKERIIMCTGEIDDVLASSICSQLLYLASLNNQPIQLYINSPGGSVSAGLAIYDTMQFIDYEISTICMGLCASMASILLATAHIHRIKEKICIILASHTQQPYDKVLQDCERDYYMDTQEVLQYGIVDQVL